MFGKTWKWAGKYRLSNKNIGIFWEQIAVQIKLLLDNLEYQVGNNIYGIDEVATRFHHKLVSIHPFPNGNGRHARLMTDIVLFNFNHERFTWGRESLRSNNMARDFYLSALRKADKGQYDDLLKFVRS